MPRHRLVLLFASLTFALLISILHVNAQDSTPTPAPNALAYFDSNALIVHDLNTNVRQELASPSFYISRLIPFTDGRFLSDAGSLSLWDGSTFSDVSSDDLLQVFDIVPNSDGRVALIVRYRDDIDTSDFSLTLWHNGTYLGLGLTLRDAAVVWSADGRLAFESTRDGNYEIYMWADSRLTNITNSPSADAHPVWSADGRLAFESSRDGAAEIYVWDGTTTVNISQSDAWDENPTWSPDGHLAFTSSSNGIRTLQLWDGSVVTDLGQADGFYMTWSADNRLAFTALRDGRRQLYLWDNGSITTISPPADDVWQPTWSADNRLAFTTRHDSVEELFVWDGTALASLGQWSAVNELTWHGDGRLAFTATADGGADIFIWDGVNTTNVTNTPDNSEYNIIWLQ
ncbi:MAG: hypothetical protein U0694_06040 [Anaerolineae bacterium]